MDILWNLLRQGNVHGALMHGRPAAGPAIAISFILVAIACSFAGLCYAELASMIPIAGSAYTYSYATLGEIFAWIIGWDLILEYAVSNVAVCVGFAGYLKAQLAQFGLALPERWSSPVWADGKWTGAYFNLPAFLVVMILSLLLVRGVRESAKVNNAMVAIKIAAIALFLVVGGSLVHKSNWVPFAPSGFSGILTGGAIVFFTYIGFDSVSTAAEESKNPQKDIPFGIIASLIVCTILYVGVAVVLTGIVPWRSVAGDGAPVVNALRRVSLMPGGHRLHFVHLAVLLGALVGMVSSILVFQLGQARVWFSMSRDRLLPDVFSRVHPRFRTPAFATVVAGFLVAMPSGLFDVGTFAEMSNIGTLFAFVLVSAGVVVLRYKDPARHRGFRVPFGPLIPILSVFFCILLMAGLPAKTWLRFFIWLAIGLVIYILYSRKRSEFYKAPQQ